MSRAVERADSLHMRPSGFTWRRDEGQTMAEYALVLGIITPVVVLALMALGDSVAPILNQVAGLL